MIGNNPADGSGELPALEVTCDICQGEGKIAPRREGNRVEFGGSCHGCGGTGTVPTADGRRLLEFLWRHKR